MFMFEKFSSGCEVRHIVRMVEEGFKSAQAEAHIASVQSGSIVPVGYHEIDDNSYLIVFVYGQQ